MIRDVLIGATPPAAFRDWRYLAVPVAVETIGFIGLNPLERFAGTFNAFDAAGLGLFCVAGTAKAMTFGLEPLQAAVLGTVTEVGGGVLRDVLVGKIPTVLRRELYAVPALLGSGVVAVAIETKQYGTAAAVGATSLVFAVRMVALRLDLHAPRPR